MLILNDTIEWLNSAADLRCDLRHAADNNTIKCGI